MIDEQHHLNNKHTSQFIRDLKDNWKCLIIVSFSKQNY